MPRKYPFETMEIGDSFTLPPGEVRFDNIKSYAYRKGVQLGARFIARQMSKGQIRVTREPLRPAPRTYAIDDPLGVAD